MTEPTAFRFGQNIIPERQTFLQTALSYAFTNIKPVVPGRIHLRVHGLLTCSPSDLGMVP